MNGFDPARQVVYEDNHLLVVNKRAGQIVQGDKTGDLPLSEAIKEWIRERDHKPGNVFLGVVHRLDRPVSGLVVFAKTSKALARMNAMLVRREIKKVYLAVTRKSLPDTSGRLEHYLFKNQEKNKSFASERPKSSWKKAVLEYRLLASEKERHLVAVRLETGRHHQIRVQLAKIGCPIAGDLKYGGGPASDRFSIGLHSARMEFIHPVSRTFLSFTAPFPSKSVWDPFRNTTVESWTEIF
ncbi:MAG: RNA pseudouridine synthase [Bacteroidales bacterium]